jgi:hypothetical protein
LNASNHRKGKNNKPSPCGDSSRAFVGQHFQYLERLIKAMQNSFKTSPPNPNNILMDGNSPFIRKKGIKK